MQLDRAWYYIARNTNKEVNSKRAHYESFPREINKAQYEGKDSEQDILKIVEDKISKVQQTAVVNEGNEKRRLKEQIKLLIVMSLVYIGGYGFMFSFPLLQPILVQPVAQGGMGYTNDEIGYIDAVGTAGYGIGGVVLSFLIPIFGAKALYIIPLVIALILNLITIPASNSFLLLLMTRFGVYFFTSTCWCAMTEFVVAWFEFGRQGRAFGVVTVASELQILIVAWNLGIMMDLATLDGDGLYHWELLIIYSSVVSALFCILGVVFLRSKPPPELAPPEEEGEHTRISSTSISSTSTSSTTSSISNPSIQHQDDDNNNAHHNFGLSKNIRHLLFEGGVSDSESDPFLPDRANFGDQQLHTGVSDASFLPIHDPEYYQNDDHDSNHNINIHKDGNDVQQLESSSSSISHPLLLHQSGNLRSDRCPDISKVFRNSRRHRHHHTKMYPTSDSHGPIGAGHMSGFQALKYYVTSLRFWLVLLYYLFLTLIYEFNTLFLPLYIEQSLGISSGNAALVSSMFSFCACITVIFGGIILDKLKWKYQAAYLVLSLCITALAYALLNILALFDGYLNIWTMTILVSVIGSTITVPYYLPMSLYSTTFGGEKYCAILTGVFDGAGYFAGTFFDLVIGYYSDGEDWSTVINLCIFFTLLATVLTFTYQLSIRTLPMYQK